MRRKAIYLILILLGLIYAIFRIYSFQSNNITLSKVEVNTKQAVSRDRYTITDQGSEIYQQVNRSTGMVERLTYEDFIVNERYVALNIAPIPYKKYGEKNREKKAQDSTIEKNGNYEELKYEDFRGDTVVDKFRYDGGKGKGVLIEYKPAPYTNRETQPNVPNPYGTVGQTVAKSRTTAEYKSSVVNLSAGEAWIVAHSRTLSKNLSKEDRHKARIDKVQRAMWIYKGYTSLDAYKRNFAPNNGSYVAEETAKNLAQEAKWMEESKNKRNQLSTLVEDNMESKYGTGSAGVVSYREDTKEFLVGPFSINYVRDVHEPIKGGLSETVGTKQGAGNLIIYSGLVGAKVHALVNGSEQELTNWEFVYNDVVEVNGSVQRKAIVNAGEDGSVINNIYPYPNEEFYIKFLNPNNSVEAITKLEFIVQTLNAEGKAIKMTGTYKNVDWVVKEKWDETLTREAYTKDYGHWDTRKDPNTGLDKRVWIPNEVRYPNLYTYTYRAWIEDKLKNTEKAADLYQIQSAKIYTKKQSVKIKVGKKNSGYKYSDYCIPLTMEIGGTVWRDGDEYGQSRGSVDGVKGAGESAMSGIPVKLYNNETGKVVATATTGSDGKYLFRYVQVGPKYYVEFEYDWMKYKATTELYKNGGAGNLNDFSENPENYLNSSHVKENVQKRKEFNQKFYEITTDKGIDRNGNTATKINYQYKQNVNPYYQTSTVQEFRETADTREAGVLLPVQNRYAIAEGGSKYLTIGIGEAGFTAITTTGNADDLQYKYVAGSFIKAQEYLRNINLGLVERAPADFAVKSDLVSTTFTLQEVYSNQNVGFDLRKNLSVDVNNRNDDYLNRKYEQEIAKESYNFRVDFAEDNFSTEEDELQLYALYEYVIENQSNLISGYITELSNYYDKEYMYPVNNDKNSTAFYSGNSALKDKALTFMQYPSYVMRNNEIIQQVEWKSTSKFNDGNGTNLNKMYTESLKNILLAPGEKISVFVYYKVNREQVNKDTPTEYKYGNYIILDNQDNGKRNIVEINAYRSLDYVEKDIYKSSIEEIGGSRVDIDSNPGDIDSNSGYINDFKYYEDDTEAAPTLRVVVKETNGKGISGYVWEDLATEKLANNQWVGNMTIDANEKNINNVFAELIRLEYNPNNGQYEEVKFSEKYEKYINAENNNIKANYGAQYANGEISIIQIKRRTGPQADTDSPIENTAAFISDGQYKFRNLIESGQYKVRFTYGDEEQLNSGEDGITYNAHDYKSTEFKGFYEESLIQTDLADIYMEKSASIKLLTTNNDYTGYANQLARKLRDTHGNFEITNNVIGTSGDEITKAISELNSSDKALKVLVLMTDKKVNDVSGILRNAIKNNIIVLVVATNNVDSKEFDIKSDNKSVIYYDTLNNTAGMREVYNRIISSVLDKNIFTLIANQSTDILENHDTVNGKVYGRADIMLKSQIMDYKKAEILAIHEILAEKDENIKKERLKEISDLEIKMTADSYPVSIKFDDNEPVKHINLGLQKIPESQLELSKEVENIIVRLSSNEEIINMKEQRTKNLQHFINDSYNIYMDEEIMQGANIEIIYKIDVTNVGEVDNLMTYLKYYDFDVKKSIYAKLGGNVDGLNEQQLDELLSRSIVVKVNTIYDYYDNMIFRAEDNNRQAVNTNTLKFNLNDKNRAVLERDNYQRLNLTMGSYLTDNVIWSSIPDYNDYAIRENIRDKAKDFKCVSTTNTKNIELFPYESIEVRDSKGSASISTYITFSKTLSSTDFVNPGSLEYRNYAEIIETYSINGRRSTDSSHGTLVPIKDLKNNKTDEVDSDSAEIVKILVPFGTKAYIAIGTILAVLVVAGGVVVVMKKRANRQE